MCSSCPVQAARQSWYSWLSFLHSLQLWQVALKRVSGRFGTGVLSYFVFIKTLLLFNVFLLLVTGAFLVLPQALFPPVTAGPTPFYGLELLTGAVSSHTPLIQQIQFDSYGKKQKDEVFQVGIILIGPISLPPPVSGLL